MAIMREGKAEGVLLWQGVHDFGVLTEVDIKLHDTGMVEIKSPTEDITQHISSCTIIWSSVEVEDNELPPEGKIRLLKPKVDQP